MEQQAMKLIEILHGERDFDPDKELRE
jgi:hypothetical protein